VPRGGREKGEREGPGRGTVVQTMGSGWLRAAVRARGGGGLANRGGRRGAGDVTDRWGGR
jgi:hypothetical protein